MSDTTPAGWYPDPEMPGQQRYWDGTQWTEHRAPGAPQAPQQFPQPQQQVAWQTAPGAGATAPTSGLAIAALVLSLVWLGGLGSVAAIVLGLIALSQIKNSNGQQGGRGIAIAGVVIGALGAIATAAIFALVVAFGTTVESNVRDFESYLDCIQEEIETGQDLNCD
jgi:hypothetical protein